VAVSPSLKAAKAVGKYLTAVHRESYYLGILAYLKEKQILKGYLQYKVFSLVLAVFYHC
jgi:hypothetical protein